MKDRSTMIAEAIILPWELFLAGKDINMPRHMDSGDWYNEQSTKHPSRIYEEHMCNKKHKVDKMSCPALVSDLMKDFNYSCSEAIVPSSSCERCAERKCENLSSLEIPCLATVRTTNGNSLLGSGKLCLTNKLNIANYDRSSVQKVFLEFNSEIFFKYQVCKLRSLSLYICVCVQLQLYVNNQLQLFSCFTGNEGKVLTLQMNSRCCRLEVITS